MIYSQLWLNISTYKLLALLSLKYAIALVSRFSLPFTCLYGIVKLEESCFDGEIVPLLVGAERTKASVPSGFFFIPKFLNQRNAIFFQQIVTVILISNSLDYIII